LPLAKKNLLKLPLLPPYATNNAHMFYIICRNINERSNLIKKLRELDIHAVFHYQSLHQSPYYKKKYDGVSLPFSDQYTETVVRLPLFYELSEELQGIIITEIEKYFNML
jgi:dTDP-4-amino-4,6-dideoxygalactose transaminase